MKFLKLIQALQYLLELLPPDLLFAVFVGDAALDNKPSTLRSWSMASRTCGGQDVFASATSHAFPMSSDAPSSNQTLVQDQEVNDTILSPYSTPNRFFTAFALPSPHLSLENLVDSLLTLFHQGWGAV